MLLNFTSASAQWSGSVRTDGAWNFKQSNNENVDFKLKYNGRKFHVASGIYAGHNFLPSTQTTSILDAKKEQNEYYKGENKEMSPLKFNAGAGIDFGYIFNPLNVLDASLSYGFSAKQSAYNLKGEDVVANLRFSKLLVKGLELYAELRDIVDKDVYEETWNAEMNYLKLVNPRPTTATRESTSYAHIFCMVSPEVGSGPKIETTKGIYRSPGMFPLRIRQCLWQVLR